MRAIVFLVALLPFCWAGHASPSLAQPVSLSETQDDFDQIFAEMKERAACLDYKRVYRLAFLGIPQNNPHLSAVERDRLNGALLRALTETNALDMTIVDAGSVGFLAGPSDLLQLEPEQLQERLDQFNADLTVLVRVVRPEPGSARLTVMVFGRIDGGGAGCDRTVNISADLATLELIENVPSATNIMTFEGFLRVFLERNVGTLVGFDQVSLAIAPEAMKECSYTQRLVAEIRDGFSQASRDAQRASVTGTSWPNLAAVGTAAEASLRLSLVPSSHAAPVAALSLALVDNEADQELDHTLESVLLEGIEQLPCAAIHPESAQDHAPPLEIILDRTFYRVGEEMRYSFSSPIDCRLTLVYLDADKDACLLLPHERIPNDTVLAGQKYFFPPGGASFRATRAGSDRLVAYCVSTATGHADAVSDLSLPSCLSGEVLMPEETVLQKLQNALQLHEDRVDYVEGDAEIVIRP